MSHHKKKYNRPEAPQKRSYPYVIESDGNGKIIRYSRNSVSWIPRERFGK